MDVGKWATICLGRGFSGRWNSKHLSAKVRVCQQLRRVPEQWLEWPRRGGWGASGKRWTREIIRWCRNLQVLWKMWALNKHDGMQSESLEVWWPCKFYYRDIILDFFLYENFNMIPLNIFVNVNQKYLNLISTRDYEITWSNFKQKNCILSSEFPLLSSLLLPCKL